MNIRDNSGEHYNGKGLRTPNQNTFNYDESFNDELDWDWQFDNQVEIGSRKNLSLLYAQLSMLDRALEDTIPDETYQWLYQHSGYILQEYERALYESGTAIEDGPVKINSKTYEGILLQQIEIGLELPTGEYEWLLI
jgi:hypothetical protein